MQKCNHLLKTKFRIWADSKSQNVLRKEILVETNAERNNITLQIVCIENL